MSGCAILPLVAAAQHGQLPYDALYGVLGGAGLNLVSNLIQQWKDRSDAEEKLPAELTAAAAGDADWRAVQDTLLEKFDMLPALQAGLSDADKTWFERSMRQALQQVDSRVTLNVVVHGGQHVAAGQYVTQVINYYGAQADAGELERYVRQYLAWVQETYGRVTLRGVRRGGSQLIELSLDEVYVPLTARMGAQLEDADAWPGTPARGRTPQRRGGDVERLPLDQLLAFDTRLVVTGGPGCGKTTVLQHVAWALASAIDAGDPALARDRVGLKVGDDDALPLPIFIPLSAYARHSRRHEGDGDPHNRTLATFIADYLIERNCAPGLPRDFFARLLNSGRGVILLLDGLDEVPDEAERAQVRQAIESLLAGKPKLRAVVTCRVAAYKGRTALGADFREVRVEPLADEHIKALVTRAYDCYFALDSAQALDKRSELLAGIAQLEQQRRARLGAAAPQLVDSPLMVRLLLIVHLNERRLPQHRAELYQKAVDNLLYPEYSLDEMAAEHLRGLVGGSHEMHRDMVQHIAYAMHGQGEEQGREIDEDALRRVLAEEPTFVPHIDELIRHTRLRGALLEERLGSYRFVHLAFQEFLAARYLAEVMRTEQDIAQFLVDHAIGDPWWREPALLTAGYLSLTSRRTADRLLRLLAVWEGHAAGNHSPADVRLAAAELAGTACLEWLGDEAALREQVTAQLTTLFTNRGIMEQAAPPVKLLAGDALGRLGDPRPGVGVKHGLPDIAWIKIPEFDPQDRREFIYQEGKHPGLPDFWMAKYPITYAQFQCFVDAQDGYRNKRWWRGLAQDYSGRAASRFEQNWPIDNRPREMVTWYEAVAFCRWLSAMLQEHPDLLPPAAELWQINRWQVRLPDEREWEKAARGWDGRQYPWGQNYENGRANVDETERKEGPYYLRETSPVGMYPHGAS
ncbi:MAG: SUMF1/EgtB/PvdO family nonheme iron enzyme, partial [Caldilinea sp.]|nr:SUMF1/EgtB/PvdO family nonheme iron enzyme [Caldilinea sp.]